MSNLFRYNTIKNLSSDFDEIIIQTVVPKPEEKDYKRGYIVRFFTQKANDVNSPILEIEREQYTILLRNPFYNVINLDWRISGQKEAVIESNSKSVRLAQKKMKSINLYLINKLQFYKG